MNHTLIPLRPAQPAGETYAERWAAVYLSGHANCGLSCRLWPGQPPWACAVPAPEAERAEAA